MYYGYKKPDIAMPHKTCPDCGAQRVLRTGIQYCDPKTGAGISTSYSMSAFWGVLACVAAILILNVGVPYVFGTGSDIASAMPLWLPVPLGLAVGIIMRVVNQRKLDAAVRVHNYRCDNCGHRWQAEEKR